MLNMINKQANRTKEISKSKGKAGYKKQLRQCKRKKEQYANRASKKAKYYSIIKIIRMKLNKGTSAKEHRWTSATNFRIVDMTKKLS